MTHFEETLQRDVERLRVTVREMAALAVGSLNAAMTSIAEGNRQLAYSVILRDQRIDELEKELDRLCLEFLVRQQPVAGTLRFAYAVIKISSELERVGDYAESMARQGLTLLELGAEVPLDRLQEIAQKAIPMLHGAVEAFVSQDIQLARELMESEETVDRLRHEFTAALLASIQQDRIRLEALVPLLNMANRLERVADQAKSICQETLYSCTGEYQKHSGAEVFRVLFVDEDNSCRSQMAEAIGNLLGQPKFVFASAGLEPRPLDATTVAFLRSKGLDLSRAASKAVNQVPHLEHYQIIVALAKEAQKIFPSPPSKVVCLDWSAPDPSKVSGSAEEVRAAYEASYAFLKTHIRDLVEAILGDQKQ